MRSINILLITIVALFPALLFGQEEFRGVVYGYSDDGHEPLPGVSIYWSGTSFGTISDGNGVFSIAASSSTSKLIFRYVGYRPDTIDISKAPDPMKVVLFHRDELDEVVINARASGTRLSRLETLPTQTITREELTRAACCNLAESFTTNASVDVSFSDAVTGARQIQLLGLSGKYVQLQTENIPNYHGLASTFGIEYIPGSWMESICISKGAASVINGYQSITGQINVEYKKPRQSEKLFLNLYMNDATHMEFNMNSSWLINENLSTMVLAHATHFDRKIDNNENGFLDKPMVSRYHLFNRWEYDPSDRYLLQAGLKYFWEDRKTGQKSFNHQKPRTEQSAYGIGIATQRMEAFMKHGIVLNHETETSIGWITSASIHEQNSFFGNTTYDGEQQSIYTNLIFESSPGVSTIQRKQKHEHEHEHEHPSGHKEEHHHGHSPEGAGDPLEIHYAYNLGISWKYDQFTERLDQQKFTDIESVPGTFAEYSINIPEKVNLLVGFRADHHNEHGWFFTPRSHFRYDLGSFASLRISAGKGYRQPRVLAENNVFLASSREIHLQDNLKMEEAWNYGISYAHYVDVFGNTMTISGDYFRTDFINQIITDLDTDVNKISFYNLNGESFANNYHFQVDYELLSALDITLGFRYSDVQATYGDRLMKRPLTSDYRGLVSLSYYTGPQGWQFDLNTQFNGGGRIPATDKLPEAYRLPESFDPYTIINLQITKFFNAFEVYAGVENLTDFVQKNPVIAPESPFGNHFDASLVWGPIHGRKIYVGARYDISR